MKKRMRYIGENIRAARQSKGYSIEKLAEDVDISESFLGLVERSESGLSLDTLIKIAKCLRVTTDSLVMAGSDIDYPPNEWEKSTNKTALVALIQNSSEAEVAFLLDFYKLFMRQGFTKEISAPQE